MPFKISNLQQKLYGAFRRRGAWGIRRRGRRRLRLETAMVRVRVTTDEDVIMEVEAEPEALEEALDVVVRVVEGRGPGGGDQSRPLLRTRLSPG